MEYHLKNSLATWGLEPASPVISFMSALLSNRPSCIIHGGHVVSKAVD